MLHKLLDRRVDLEGGIAVTQGWRPRTAHEVLRRRNLLRELERSLERVNGLLEQYSGLVDALDYEAGREVAR